MRSSLHLLWTATVLALGCGDNGGDTAATAATSLPNTNTSVSSTTNGTPTTGATTSSSSGAECPGPGFLGCPCTEDGKCLEGFKCLPSINTCIDPADLTGGEAESTTAANTTGEDCPEGFQFCPCAPGGVCVIGLECIEGMCWVMPDGTTGDGTTGDVCLDDYQTCFSQAECCDEGQHCLDFTQTNGDGVICAPECGTHTECPSKCCGGVGGLTIHVCYSAPCETLCANTCQWAYDGQCDDGGLDSEFAVCEYGTDCFDCGNRSSAGAPW